jgi:hypothetical protein
VPQIKSQYDIFLYIIKFGEVTVGAVGGTSRQAVMAWHGLLPQFNDRQDSLYIKIKSVSYCEFYFPYNSNRVPGALSSGVKVTVA